MLEPELIQLGSFLLPLRLNVVSKAGTLSLSIIQFGTKTYVEILFWILYSHIWNDSQLWMIAPTEKVQSSTESV